MRATLLVIPLVLVGCGTLSAYPVQPHVGTWDVEITGRSLDECRMSDTRAAGEDDVRPGIRSLFTQTEAMSFDLALNGGDPAPCALEGNWFECQPSVERIRVSDTVTITQALTASGWFDNPGMMEAEFLFDLSCRGSGCADFAATYGFETLPCRIEGTYVAVADGDPDTI